MSWPSIIGKGSTAFATCTDGETVLKSHQVWEDGILRASLRDSGNEEIAHEATMYTRMGVHPRILQFMGLRQVSENVLALQLELAPLGTVRDYVDRHARINASVRPAGSALSPASPSSDGGNGKSRRRDPPPARSVRLQLALDLAAGLAHAHACGLWHGDISCRNLFLFDGMRGKLGDFGNARIHGTEPEVYTADAEAEYDMPCRGRSYSYRPWLERELFALGSGIYEIMAWARLFPDLQEFAINRELEAEQFPSLDVGDVPMVQDIVWRCWQEGYECAEEVVRDLTHVLHRHQG